MTRVRHLALIVDADPDTRQLYREYLARQQWSILEAESGPDGLAQAIGHEPDLIVSDTRLPGFDGLALCELVRRDVATYDTPFLFVTADAQLADLEAAAAAGADAVLTKPCPPRELLDSFRAARKRIRPRLTDFVPLVQPDQDENAAAEEAPNHTISRRATLRKAHRRGVTAHPPLPPPSLRCPRCNEALRYLRSHIGGVSSKHPEQWDYLECRNCGGFEYRVRTRTLRQVGPTSRG